MDKEEALKVLREAQTGWTIQEALETLIPELRESEDERIMQEIIDFIQWAEDRGMTRHDYHQAKRPVVWIAYLEKQKEKPKSADSIPSDCVSDAKCEDRSLKHTDSFGTDIRDTPAYWRGWDDAMKQKEPHYTKRNALFDKCVAECDPAVMKEVSNEIDEMLEKEQKPVDVEYIGGIREELLGIEDNAKNIDGLTESQWVAIRAAHRLLGEYLEQEQKPADRFEEARQKYQVEWGEEDNIGWDEAFACVTRAEKVAKNEEELQNAVTAEKWLKEIKFKYYVHPVKQEWSEEDEKIAKEIEEELWYPGDFPDYPSKEENELYDDCQRRLNWFKNRLKSLRPQPIQLKEAYKDGFQTARHATALTFMNYLDENRPEGKMGLSNAECEDIDKAFKENDWEKIIQYADKYSWKPSEEQIHAIVEALKYLPNNKDEWMILNTLVDVLRKLM